MEAQTATPVRTRNKERFMTVTGRSEQDYQAWASQVGRQMHVNTLDRIICAKMTAVNMCIHGCVGEAVCMDSLALTWRFGYRVNHRLNLTGVPTIEPITEQESRIMAHWLSEKAKPAPAQEGPAVSKRGQFMLF